MSNVKTRLNQSPQNTFSQHNTSDIKRKNKTIIAAWKAQLLLFLSLNVIVQLHHTYCKTTPYQKYPLVLKLWACAAFCDSSFQHSQSFAHGKSTGIALKCLTKSSVVYGMCSFLALDHRAILLLTVWQNM